MKPKTKSKSKISQPYRRPSQGGYASGENTRMRVINAAISVFATKGYKQASTRDIAAEAGVKPPALQYYFDSKLGLYHACVDLVTITISKQMQPSIESAGKALHPKAKRGELIEGVCVLQEGLIDAFYGEPGSTIGRLLAWEDYGADASEVRRLVLDRLKRPIVQIAAGLIGRIIGKPVNDLQTGFHTFAVLGQTVMFHLEKGIVAELLQWPVPSDKDLLLLKSVLRAQSTAMLRSLAVEPPKKK